MTNSVISRSACRKNHARLHGTTESLLLTSYPATETIEQAVIRCMEGHVLGGAISRIEAPFDPPMASLGDRP